MLHPSGKGQDGGGGKTDKTLADFAAEYAKSNRSTCKGCMEKIEKVSPGEGFGRWSHLAVWQLPCRVSREEKMQGCGG